MSVSWLLSITWLLDFVKVDLELIYMMSWSLERKTNMCEQL